MADEEIYDAEIIDDDAVEGEVIDAEFMDGRERQVDGLSVAAFASSFIVVLYPFNALVAIVLALSARTTLRRTGRSGRGFARAGLILGIAELLLGILVILGALLAAHARAVGESDYIPEPQSTACVSLPHDCKVADDAAQGAQIYVDAMKKLASSFSN